MRIKKRKFAINTVYYKNVLHSFLREHSALLWLFLCVFTVGLITGAIVAVRLSDDFVKPNVFELLKTGEYAYMSSFLTFVCFAAFTVCVAFLSVFRRFCAVFSFVWIAYCGYRAGIHIIGCVHVATFTGIICSVFYYLPLYLNMTLCALVTVSHASRYWIAKGATLTCTSSILRALKIAAIVFGVYCVVAFCICVIMPKITVIIFL